MNIQEARAYGRSCLDHSPTPDLDARLLLEHVLQVPHSYLVAHADEELTAANTQQFLALVDRAWQHEPIPYLIGHAPFYGLEFTVNPSVLIPRPESEQLVDFTLAWAREHNPVDVVDVGTGSGCIAVCLALHLPQARIEAVDISSQALRVAKQNARHHVPDRIHFYEDHLLAGITHPVDLIVANLPYVTEQEWTTLDDGVKWFEPATALKGGDDGLDLVRQLLNQATSKLRPGGAIFLEIGWQQGQATLELAKTVFPDSTVKLLADYAGHDRVVAITAA